MNQKIDSVLALADRQIGSLAPSPSVPLPPSSVARDGDRRSNRRGEGSRRLVEGSPPADGFGLPYGPVSPAPEPPQDIAPDFMPSWAAGAGLTGVHSVPGTPIVSGFLTDVGEYNPELQGRAAVQVYEKMRRGDGQVEATLQALTLPVLSADWEVVAAACAPEPGATGAGAEPSRGPSADGPPSPASSGRGAGGEGGRVASTGVGKATASKAKEIAAFIKSNLFGGLEFRTATGGWASQSWEEVVRNALLMLPFGVSAHEDVYTLDGASIRLRMLADLTPVTFYRWHVDPLDGRTLLYLGQYGYRGARFEQVSVPADKLTVFSFRKEGANFWGRSVLRPAYPHWYVKNQLYRIDAIGAERNSLGVPTIVLPPGYSREDHDAAVNFVTQLAAHERTGVVLPNGATFEILGIKGTLKELNTSIQHHNEQISVQALAMFMNLGRTTTGSRSLGREHSKFFMLSLQNVADKVAEQITNSTVRRLVYYNFGVDAPVPRLVAANVQARALEDIVDALTRFAETGLVVSDLGLRAKIREDLALPAETSEGVVVRQPTDGKRQVGEGSGQ